MTTYVWDATLLLHAQAADRADVLGSLVPAGRHVTTEVVRREIRQGLPSWVTIEHTPDDQRFLELLGQWRLRCNAGEGRNEGEAGPSPLTTLEASRQAGQAAPPGRVCHRLGG